MLRSVKLAADPDVAAWLGKRPATEWDAGNSSKRQAKHGFSIADVVFARRGEKLRPISCRAMRKKEKEAYDAAT